jgi:hypothetical protein
MASQTDEPVMLGEVQEIIPGRHAYIPIEGLREGLRVGRHVTTYDRPFRGAQVRLERKLDRSWTATVDLAAVEEYLAHPPTVAQCDGDGKMRTVESPNRELRRILNGLAYDLAAHPGASLTLADQ